MVDFAQQIKQSEVEINEAQTRIKAFSERLEQAQAKMAKGQDISIDIENASLDDVHAHTEVMNGNIAEMIVGLDAVTSAFSKDFDLMRTKSGWEKFVGVFSKNRAESIRAERIREASIDDKLQDLIGKSDTIVALLRGQMDVLEEQKVKVEANLTTTLAEREGSVAALEEIRARLISLDPDIIKIEDQISMEQDAKKRTKLEAELAKLNTEHNEMVREEQVKLAESQTLERYIEKGKTWVDSLQNQAATQMVLINKLETDTKQRVVLYDALTKSLKTAQQQDVAHRINEIGVQTDKEAQQAMAAIGSATSHRMAEMLESHEDNMVFARKVLEEKKKSDDRFARRFEKIIAKHDSNNYGA